MWKALDWLRGPSELPDMNFQVERLESRHLLSGIVKLTFNNGNLKLTGDAENNYLDARVDTPTTLSIKGMFGTELSVNGVLASSHTIPLSGVTIRDLSVNLRGGNDSFILSQDPTTPHRLFIDRDVRIHAGSGDSDRVVLDLIATGRNLTIMQAEDCRPYGAYVGGDLRVVGSQVRDEVEINDYLGVPTFVGDDLSIVTKGGDDYIWIWGVEIGSPSSTGSLKVNAGSGDDDLYDVHTVEVWGDAVFNMGSGADVCFLEYGSAPTSLNLHGNLSVQLGSGNDSLLIANSSLDGRVSIATGGGADYVYLHDLDVYDALKANLGGGSDAWYMHDVALLGSCSITGSAGSDWISMFNVAGTTPTETSFEYQTLPGDFWTRFP